MQVVVDLPRLVADPQVVARSAHHVVEDHEVRGEDLVHVPPGAEHRKGVLGRVRAVAERADVPLSLVHYHFGSMRGLLVAVLEDLTATLLERQRAMFRDGRPFADQWRTACEYLRDDVGSGYVRILWELWAAGLADPELAERWRETQPGVALPMRPRVLTAFIANLFAGAETEILAGVGEDESPHLEALEALAGIIERVERA